MAMHRAPLSPVEGVFGPRNATRESQRIRPRLTAGTLPWALVALMLFATAASPVSAATATIRVDERHQTIRGFGGATVFQPPDLPASLTEAEMDALFGNGPGQIGFSILRIRVAPDDEWRAIELAHARGARARGAAVIATPWSPPAEMKSNNSLVDGYLLPSRYADYARYLNDFALYMAAEGAPLEAVSVQNEPDIDVDYESCDWTPAQMLEFCRDHAGAITATRLIAPESFQFRRAMSDPILNDATALANVDIIGGHIYGGGLRAYPLAAERGRELWMTEYLELSTDWAGALQTGRQMHQGLADAGFSAFIWWYLRRYYGPLGEDGVVTKRGYVMSQFAKYIRPGYVRVGAPSSPTASVYVSAYARETLVIVAVNLSASSVSQEFSIAGGSVRSVTPWTTSVTLNMAEQPAITVSEGVFAATLPASSVTTFVGELVFPAPSITAQPASHVVASGTTAVVDVAAEGESLRYQWMHEDTEIAGATGRQLVLADVAASHAGAYRVRVSNSGGSVLSGSATLTVTSTADPGRLVNISARAPVGTGNGALIGGFVVSGGAPKPILVRAAGPALHEVFRLEGVLADPVLSLHVQGGSEPIATNDNWDAALAPTFARCGAFGWAEGSADAAVLQTLDPGIYTAVVGGADGGSGIALVEIYDAEAAAPAPLLVNLSARSPVQSGDGIQIAGFYIRGSTSCTVLVRAGGPALRELSGLAGTLADPVFELRDEASRTIIARNDDWDEAIASYAASAGAFPWLSRTEDAAVLVTLRPGAYTATVHGKDDAGGIALVEIYAVP